MADLFDTIKDLFVVVKGTMVYGPAICTLLLRSRFDVKKCASGQNSHANLTTGVELCVHGARQLFAILF